MLNKTDCLASGEVLDKTFLVKLERNRSSRARKKEKRGEGRNLRDAIEYRVKLKVREEKVEKHYKEEKKKD